MSQREAQFRENRSIHKMLKACSFVFALTFLVNQNTMNRDTSIAVEHDVLKPLRDSYFPVDSLLSLAKNPKIALINAWGRSWYNPFTHAITLYRFNDSGKPMDLRKVFLIEVSHALQNTAYKRENFIMRYVSDFFHHPYYDNETMDTQIYAQSGTLEHEAHDNIYPTVSRLHENEPINLIFVTSKYNGQDQLCFNKNRMKRVGDYCGHSIEGMHIFSNHTWQKNGDLDRCYYLYEHSDGSYEHITDAELLQKIHSRSGLHDHRITLHTSSLTHVPTPNRPSQEQRQH